MQNMPIHDDFKELEDITIEMKRLRGLIRTLGERKQECEARILYFMTENGYPGLTFGNTLIERKQTTCSKRTSKAKRLARGEQILAQHGVSQADEILKELFDGIKGSPVQKQGLKVRRTQ